MRIAFASHIAFKLNYIHMLKTSLSSALNSLWKVEAPNFPLNHISFSFPLFLFYFFLVLIFTVFNMDTALEELWKKFNLSKDEKGALSVNSQDVAQSKEQA